MTMNFMDNTYDACRYMFTKGQKKRIHATISASGFRSKLGTVETQCHSDKLEDPVVYNGVEYEMKEQEADLIKLMPNPASEFVSIIFSKSLVDKEIQISAFNAAGEIVMNASVQQELLEYKIDLREWPSGLYLLSFKTVDSIYTEKLIVE